MKKTTFAKITAWTGAALAACASQGLFGKFSSAIAALAPMISALAVHHASDTSADNPSGVDKFHPASLRALILVSFLAIAGTSARAQSLPNNIYAAGASYNPGGSPSAAGTALYAHLISNDLGTYGFTVFDAFPVSAKPFTVNTNVGGGVAQKVFTIGKIPIFVPTNAGISFNGKNTGWSWSTGGMASIKLKGNWRIFPNARWQKSTVSNGSGVQLIAGVLLGWGK